MRTERETVVIASPGFVDRGPMYHDQPVMLNDEDAADEPRSEASLCSTDRIDPPG